MIEGKYQKNLHQEIDHLESSGSFISLSFSDKEFQCLMREKYILPRIIARMSTRIICHLMADKYGK
jgi:hypothetical protein